MPPESYFTDDSMVRRVHREFVVGLAGPRTLLLQASHPVAFAGFFAHTGALDEPYERLARTAQVMDAITFGPRAAADRMTRRVRAMHRRVRGELSAPAGRFPAGTPYAADDPELLLWILAAIVDSSLLVYGKYVRRLSRDEREAYWQDYKVIGRQFGLADDEMPDTIEDFDAYMARDARRAATCTSPRRPASWRSRSSCARRCRSRSARCSSSPTRSRSGCCRARSGAATACRGIRPAPSPSTAGPSTSGASSSRCCPSGCG